MADERPPIPAGILRGGVVAIARRQSRDTAPAIARALADGGVGAVEITLDDPTERALATLRAVVRAAEGLDVGAGTVLSTESAQAAIDAGATFLVMPHTDMRLIEWAAGRGIATLPGAATPTEALAAWRAGAAAIKVFPASVLGPAFIRELHGPFPDLPMVPTGGVTADSAAAFIKAGAIAVGLGGWLLGDGELAGVTGRARRITEAVAVARERPTA